ncbi:hypothetical protein CSUI_008306 [Cystoisospora suis]|uniref:Uncharacterized protein n=1 Tax=Cystoisospora suis TaxID=483139 RepID=A0A2C6KN11_9APIC|nr:hypothetical protein CSUI_008306 [Cystoisospora suis]
MKMPSATLDHLLASEQMDGVNLDTSAFIAACSELTHSIGHVEESLTETELPLFKPGGPPVFLSDVVENELRQILNHFVSTQLGTGTSRGRTKRDGESDRTARESYEVQN